MTRKIPKYNEEGSKVIGTQEVKVIAQVKYIGEDTISFDNEKIYDVIDFTGRQIRVIDESNEDYLFDFYNPNINNDRKGKFEIFKDFTKNKLFTKTISTK